MERFTMRIAGRVVAVTAMYASTLKSCEAYLFDAAPDFTIEITPEDITFERETSAQERKLEGLPEFEFDDSLLESTALQRKVAEKLFEYDTLLFHGSVIAVDGEGYLFTAKSGTGKSTHTLLWRKMLRGSGVMVNDDKPFLKMTEAGVRVFGSPWNGKHGLGRNIDVPLKGICILERGEQNEIHRISAKEAVLMLLQQSNRPKQPAMLHKYLELLEDLANKTLFYRMRCNMEPEAAVISYQAMSGRVKE